MSSTPGTDSTSASVAPHVTDSEMGRVGNGMEMEKLLETPVQTDLGFSLLQCVENGDANQIISLIRSGADVNYRNKNNNCRAVDLAWNQKDYEKVLILLRNDSVFPENCKGGKLPSDCQHENLKKFIENRRYFHNLIATGDLKDDGDKSKIESYMLLNKSKFYLNEKNESVLYIAIIKRKFEMYGFLISKGADFKDEEEKKVIKRLSDFEKEKLEKTIMPNLSTHSQATVYAILSKTSWLYCIKNPENKLLRYYDKLVDDNFEIKEIFNVIRVSPHLFCVSFDFKRENVYCMSPTCPDNTTGNTRFKDGIIYIAAHKDRGEKKILGTIAHELTHMVMEILYENECNPYDDRGEERESFVKIRGSIENKKADLRQTGNKSKNLLSAFDYPKKDFDCELIARVSEILAEYGDNGRTWLKDNVLELYDFYKKVVIPKCQTYIKESSLSKPKSDIRSLNERLGEINEIKKINLYLQNSVSCRQLNDIQNQKAIFLITTDNIRITTIKVLQQFYGKNYLSSYDNYLVLKFNVYNQRPFRILQNFLSEASKTLILEYDRSVEGKNLEEAFRVLEELLMKRPNKKIIFIASNHDDCIVLEIENHLRMLDLYLCKVKDSVTLFDLTKDSRKNILERNLSFSGEIMTLQDLIGENNKELLKTVDGGSMLELLSEEKIQIGSNAVRSADLEGAYADFVKEIEDLKTFVQLMKNFRSIFIFNALQGLKIDFSQLFENVFHPDDFIEVDTLEDSVCWKIKNCTITITNSLTIDKIDEFKKMCRKYRKTKIYWINVKSHEGKLRFFLQQFYNPKFYLSRYFIFLKKLVIKRDIIQELIKSDLLECFIVSSLDQRAFLKLNAEMCSGSVKDKLKNNCESEKVLFIEEEEEARLQFEEKKIGSHTVHWLKWDGKDIVWNDSSGSMATLRPYFDEHNELEIEEENLINEIRERKVVIIADDPGMGKSTTLTKLYECDSIYKTHWIIRINLKDHLKKIKQLSLNKINHVDFLLMDSSSVLERRLLEYALIPENMAMPLLIAFDGFDELLDETDRRTIIMLLKYLRDKTSCKIWITTRVHHKDILGNELSTLAIKFVPLNDTLKKKFIKSYLEDRFYFFNEDLKLEFKKKIEDVEILKDFLNAMKNIFKADWSTFIGTPLQLQLMLECYAEDFQNYNRNNQIKFNWNENILEIYRKFITKKYDVFCKKKINYETSALVVKQWKTILNQYNKDLVKVSALHFDRKKFLDQFKNIALLLGLVKFLPEELEFIHPTFRDYFAAKIFYGWIKKKKTNFVNHEKLQYLFKDALVQPVFRLSRNFMSLKLKNMKVDILTEENVKYFAIVIRNILKDWGSYGTEESFLDVIIREDNTDLFDFIVTIIKKAESNQAIISNYLWEFLNLKNRSGQSLLFLVCKKKSKGVFESMLTQILQMYHLLDIKDDFQRTPAHCAVISDNLEILEILFKKIPKQELTFLGMKDDTGKTPLHYAVKLHSEKVTKFLLEKVKKIEKLEEATNFCYDLLCMKDSFDQTPIHLASEAGNADIINIILDELESLNSTERFFDALCMIDGSFRTPFLCAYQNNKNEVFEAMQRRVTNYYEAIDFSKLSDEDELLFEFQHILSIRFFDIKVITFPLQTNDLSHRIQKNGNELLLIAAKKGKEDIVKFLIKCEVDLNYSDNNGYSAVDHAWENKNYNILLLLLKADSLFPRALDLTELNDQFQNQKDLRLFVEDRNLLHQSIKNGDKNEVVKLTASRTSKFYLNFENKSAVFVSLENKKFDIYGYLKLIGNELKKDEIVDDDIEIHDNSKSKSHILYLLSISRSISDQPETTRFSKIRSYYEHLNLIPNIAIILEAMQCIKDVDIVFDFLEEDISKITPLLKYEKNCEREINRVIIPVEKHRKDRNKVVLGKIIHEFTHLIMQEIFQNDCKPYDETEEESKAFFQTIKQQIDGINSTENDEILEIFLKLFQSFDSTDFDAEIIATVPQVLVQYKDEGPKWLQAYLPDLYRYYEEFIMQKCKEMIKNRLVSNPIGIEYIQFLQEKKDFKKYNIHFKNVNNDFIPKTSSSIFAVGNTLLGTICTLQMLFGFDYITNNTYLTFEFEVIMAHLGEIMSFFKSKEEVNLLIVRFSSNFCNLNKLEELYSIISTIVDDVHQKRVAFVVHHEMEKEIRQSKILAQAKILPISDDNLSLFDLDENSQKMFLEKQILFQGTDMKLSDLITSNKCLYKLIKGELINNLLNKDKVSIGTDILDSSSLYGAYIRIFEKMDVRFFFDFIMKGISDHVFLIYDLPKSNMKEKFVDILSEFAAVDVGQDAHLYRSIDEIDLGKYKINKNNNKRLLLTSYSVTESDFRKFCKDNPKSTIYFIETNTNDKMNPFTLQILYNPNFYVHRKFMKTTPPEASISGLLTESDLRKIVSHEKVLLLVGGPGSGKTTSLTSLYDDELIAGNYWIVRINIGKHLKEIQSLDCTNLTIESVVHFLQQIEPKLKDELLEKLLESALNPDKKFTKNLLVVFDEFDALSNEDDKQKAILLFKYLKHSKSTTLWIATRQHCQTCLEQELSVFAVELLPMDPDMKITFMQNYLRDRVKLTSNIKLFDLFFDQNDRIQQKGKLYLEEWLKKVGSFFNADLSYSIGNPSISVLIMAMEIFLNHFKHRVASNLAEDLDSLYIDNIVEFCESFVNLKSNVYFKSRKIHEKYIQNREKEIIEQHLKYLAESIILKQPLQKLLEYDELLLSTGIVRLKHGSLEFIHEFLKDFYGAKTFIQLITNNFSIPSNVKKKILKILEESTNKRLRFFINVLLQKIDLESFKNFKTSREITLDSTLQTCLQREEFHSKTALHIAIEENNYHIFRFLFLNCKKAFANYAVLLKISNSRNQTLLSYSAGNFDIFRLLYSEILNSLSLPELEYILLKETENGTILIEAAMHGRPEIVKLLFEEKRVPLEIQRKLLVNKENGQTALYLAVSINDLTVVEALLIEIKRLLSEDERKSLLTKEYNLNQTILHIAAENGSYDILKLLLQHLKPLLNDAELHEFFITKVDNGGTILHSATKKGSLDIVRLLIDSEKIRYLRQFITVTDNSGKTVFDLAMENNFFSIFKLMLEKAKAVLTPDEQQHFLTLESKNINSAFFSAVDQNNLEKLKKWFDEENGKLPLATRHDLLLMVDDYGKTALNVAVKNSNLDLTIFLFQKAREVLNPEELGIFFKSGENNILLAARTDDLKLVDLILDEGEEILKYTELNRFMEASGASHNSSYEVKKLILKKVYEKKT